jgi:hypothetical protein
MSHLMDTATLSDPEIDLLVLAGRRGSPLDHGREHARQATARGTAALIAVAGAVWALNVVCVGVHLH